MSKLAVRVAGAGLLVLTCPGLAAALTLTVQSPGPVAVGKSQTYRVTKVDEAVGEVTFTWNFGDGTPVTGTEVTHTFQKVGHPSVIITATDSASGASTSFTQVVHYPVTAQAPHNPSSIIVDADRHRVWNVNPDNDSVTIIDSDALTRVREVPVGKEPHSLAQAPDGSIWVANQMSDEVLVLDRDSGVVLTRIAMAYASQPRSIVFGGNGKAYVSLYATGKLVEIDGTTRQILRESAIGPTPAGVSVAADGRIFVTRFLSPSERGEVWVVSPQSLTVTKTIELPFDQGPDTESSSRGVPNYVASIVISPDGTQGWVTAKKDNIARGRMRDTLPTNSDNFVRAIICIVDLKTETENLAQREDIDNRALPVSVVFSPVGDTAYVLAMASNWVGITDAYEVLNLSGINQVGNAPDGLALAPNGRLFVSAYLSREVIAYDLRSSLSSIDHSVPPALARIRAVDREVLPAPVLLGKQIFFNAADTRMSNDGYMSCVSCHFGGYSDSRVWDFSDRGEGLRNTKSLLGIRGMGEGRVHWSANFDEIQDFERDIRQDFEGSGFMPDSEFKLRSDANNHYLSFGAPSAGLSKELDGLAAFITSLNSVPRSPFRNRDGSFTPAAVAGRKVFERAGCEPCHSGPDLTDSATGLLHDVGTLLPTSGMRLFESLKGIDTPTLKGVWNTAPYYHDGRAATLMEIFTKYNDGDKMGTTSNLKPYELEQLVEYLLELDDVPVTATPTAPPTAVRGYCSVGPVSSLGGTAAAPLWSSLAGAALAVAVATRRRRGAGRRAR